MRSLILNEVYVNMSFIILTLLNCWVFLLGSNRFLLLRK